MTTETTITSLSKYNAPQHCDVEHCHRTIGKLVNALANNYDDVVYDMDNSRDSHEQNTITFTDSHNREVTLRVVIRTLRAPGNHKVGVSLPMTYIDYHPFIASIKNRVGEVLTEFFNGCMDLYKNDTMMECDCDITEDSGYYNLVIENKQRTFMLKIDLDYSA
jgi:hypothetical protein